MIYLEAFLIVQHLYLYYFLMESTP